MRRMMVVVAAAMVALGGCAEPFTAKVSRFQALPAPTGQSFAIEASDPKLRGGLEFQQYAQIVSSKLVEKGYRQAPEGTSPDLIVRVDYSVDNGRERVESTGFGGFGGFGYGGFGRFGGFGGYGYRPFVYGFYDPYFYGFGPGFGYNDIRSYTIYTSELDLKIARAADGQNLFEGTAKAVSADDDLTHLVPNLITAMFTGFPGNSGETVKITIPPAPKTRS